MRRMPREAMRKKEEGNQGSGGFVRKTVCYKKNKLLGRLQDNRRNQGIRRALNTQRNEESELSAAGKTSLWRGRIRGEVHPGHCLDHGMTTQRK